MFLRHPHKIGGKIGDTDAPFIEVSGVVGDVRSVSLERAPGLTVYVPYWQRRTWGGPSLAVKLLLNLALCRLPFGAQFMALTLSCQFRDSRPWRKLSMNRSRSGAFRWILS